MPFGREGLESGSALALSGGGFRAMLFHTGAVWRINELGLLRGLKRISSVSGGSIFAGRLAVAWGDLSWSANVATDYRTRVADPVLSFATRHVDVPAIAKGILPFRSAAREAEGAYRDHLVGETSLQGLMDEGSAPRFVFNATHLGAGASWRFSKPYMGCYRIGLVRQPDVLVATAIAASAAFPPVLSPLELPLDPSRVEGVEGADLHGELDYRKKAYLSDGGVYDNLALETVWSRYETVLCSDAGGPMDDKPGRYLLQLKRTLDIARDQAQKLRRVGLIADFRKPGRGGSFWMTRTDIRDYPVASPFPVHADWPAHLAAIRTRLNPFSEEERARLVNWGYLVADVALRSFVVRNAAPPQALPFPGFDFQDRPPR